MKQEAPTSLSGSSSLNIINFNNFRFCIGKNRIMLYNYFNKKKGNRNLWKIKIVLIVYIVNF